MSRTKPVVTANDVITADDLNPDKAKKEAIQAHQEAIKTLIIGCRLGQEKGTYTLEEARTIMNAIDFLNELNANTVT